MKRIVQVCVVLAGTWGASQDLALAQQARQIGGVHEARLSGYCQSITSDQASVMPIGDLRVRRGGAVIASGVRQSIFVESGGKADVTGVGSTVYVAKGGRVTVGGQRNQVISEVGSSVILVGVAILTVVDTIDLQVNANSPVCQ